MTIKAFGCNLNKKFNLELMRFESNSIKLVAATELYGFDWYLVLDFLPLPNEMSSPVKTT